MRKEVRENKKTSHTKTAAMTTAWSRYCDVVNLWSQQAKGVTDENQATSGETVSETAE